VRRPEDVWAVNRRIVANLAVFALISGAFVYWALANILHVNAIEHPFTVKVDFPAAFGVLKNSEVTYLGTQIGDVRTTKRIPGGVEVIMQLRHGTRVPYGAFAHIARKSAIGEPYVDFTPAPGSDGGGPFLRPGDTIPVGRTAVPIEFADMLRAASRLVSAIPAADAHTLIHELAIGLHGRTDDLRTIAEDGDRLASALADRTATLDRLASNNTRLTAVVAAHSGSLTQTLADLRAVSASLKNAKGDIGPLLDRGNALLADLVPLVRDHRGDLSCLLGTVGRVVDVTTTPARIEGLKTTLDGLPAAFDDVFAATDVETLNGAKRRWVRVGFLENTSSPPPQFLPAKPTPPPVPAVPPCAAVTTASADPGVPVTPVGRLPATGGHGAAGPALAALALAGCGWQSSQRARRRGARPAVGRRA
jgi:phospholipid/cholesterol/gamma-HCH transport system substrate-binding protein